MNASFSCFRAEGNWYKGNLHSHSTMSDGQATPQEVVDWYRAHGYDFFSLTDHDVIADVSSLDQEGILLLPGIEFGFGYPHDTERDFIFDMLGINMKQIPEFLDPDHTGKVHYPADVTPQQIIDAVVEQGALAIMCHPYFLHNLIEPYLKCHSYHGIEAYNYVTDVSLGQGYHEIYWDALLYRGRQLLGFAVDDSHVPDFGHAWIIVKAKEKTIPAIMEALRAGSFYSTTGIEIFDVDYTTNHIRVAFDRPCDVVFACEDYCRTAKIYAYDNTWEMVNGRRRFYAEMELTGKERYLRIELIDQQGKKAYTNPIYPNPKEWKFG